MDRTGHNRKRGPIDAFAYLNEPGQTRRDTLALHGSENQLQIFGWQDSLPVPKKQFAEIVPSPDKKDGKNGSPVDVEPRKGSDYEMEMMLQAVIEACTSNVAVLNNAGTIIAVNKSWRLFADQYSCLANRCGVGLKYLEMCSDVWGIFAEE